MPVRLAIPLALILTLGLCSATHFAAGQPQQPARQLAPGVLTVIPSPIEEGDTFTGPLPSVELTTGRPHLDWSPHYAPKSDTLLEKAKVVVLRREVWGLEFAFKPLRMIQVDVPQPDGSMQRKLIWYLVYRVKNVGGNLQPTPKADETFALETVDRESLRFFPHFVLESQQMQRTYLDRIIPAAIEPIQRRETPGFRLYNSGEITRVPIPLSDEQTDRSVWGVATWEDVDPRLNYFSIYVQGLTNAYQFEDPEGAYQAGDPPGTGRRFFSKTLQLNFWRWGDPSLAHEDQIRYGIPPDPDPDMQQQILEHYGVHAPLDYLWVYR